MKTFRKFALASTIAVYFLIFVGGLVRVSGAGLGCPDWPKCFDRWFPPTSISQLPANIDPSQFNFVLAWIEYFNRLIGVTVGFLITITAVWALLKYSRVKHLVYPSVLAVILTAYQGWQGGALVESGLKAHLVSIHMGLAFIISALMLYVTQQAYYLENKIEKTPPDTTSRLKPWLLALFLFTIIEVFLGTELRAAWEAVQNIFPLLGSNQLFEKLGSFHYIHMILGIGLTILSWQVGARIIRNRSGSSSHVDQATWAIMIIASIQVLMGALMFAFGVPPVMQLFHLLLSAIYFGLLVFIWSGMKQEGRLN